MSVSDPLIRDIKGCTLRLLNEIRSKSERPTVDDASGNLTSFCECLEKIFHKGLIETPNKRPNSSALLSTLIGFGRGGGGKKCHVYTWMTDVGDMQDNLAYRASIERMRARKFNNVKGPLGRFRLLVRCCLVKKCLHAPVLYLVNSGKCLKYYQSNSILGDEILAKILLSVLLQLGKMQFDLDLENSSFLDVTWALPEVVRLELVPCSTLGIAVSYSEDKAVIVTLKSNGVVSENGKVLLGDVLDNLNGHHIDYSTKGQLSAIFNKNKGKPIQMVIVKGFNQKKCLFYPPIRQLLLNLRLDIEDIRRQYNSTPIVHQPGEVEIEKPKSGFEATYLGSVDTGDRGNVKQVEVAINSLLQDFKKKLDMAVVVEIGEINVKVVASESGEEILKHSFMQISSCGSLPAKPHYIAYIAGKEYCDEASEFVAYVFHVENTDNAATILQSIGQGFHRTHFAV